MAERPFVPIFVDDAVELALLALVGWGVLARRGENPPSKARQFAECLATLRQDGTGRATFAPFVDDSSHDDGVALITTSAAADLLGVSTRTVNRLVADGRLERVKVRGATRFRRHDVLALSEES